mgnify:CR=1 FL=1
MENIKAYVINLKKRPDRLQRFMENIGNQLSAEVVEGLDGSEIDPYNDYYRKNVNEWNFKHLSDKSLRGVIGCCVGHLSVYEKIIEKNIPRALIFEDDAHPEVDNFKEIIDNIVFPEKFSVIYLNQFSIRLRKSEEYVLKEINRANETAESYIISNEFAKLAYEYSKNNIGAADAHLHLCYEENKEYTPYILSSPIFRQYNRKDSNIR